MDENTAYPMKNHNGDIVLTGIRPTGMLHIGHYMGAVKEFIDIEIEQKYLLISDLHFLTTRCTKSEIMNLKKNVYNLIIDCLGTGVSTNTNFYLQSKIPELTELYVLIQNFISVDRIKKIQSLQHMAQTSNIDCITLGLLGYPILEAGDIIAMQANIVTVGKDNIDHIKITTEILKRLNAGFDCKLPIPRLITGIHNNIIGLDGQKMSKSLGNIISIRDTENEIDAKIDNATWIPVNNADKNNPIISYIEIFGETDKRAQNITNGYYYGENVESDAREYLKELLNNTLKPFRSRIQEYSEDFSEIEKILINGTEISRERIVSTVKYIKKAIALLNYI